MEKDCCNLQCFKEKITKIILEKKHKKNKRKKNHAGKHCSNLQCFMLKYTIIILNQFNIKKIKFTKIILKILITKKMQGMTVAIHNVLKKKNTKQNSQPA